MLGPIAYQVVRNRVRLLRTPKSTQVYLWRDVHAGARVPTARQCPQRDPPPRGSHRHQESFE
eukprot:1594141-Pyramimonas_sp.AAC.1